VDLDADAKLGFDSGRRDGLEGSNEDLIFWRAGDAATMGTVLAGRAAVSLFTGRSFDPFGARLGALASR
jgi:hypothetical protein